MRTRNNNVKQRSSRYHHNDDNDNDNDEDYSYHSDSQSSRESHDEDYWRNQKRRNSGRNVATSSRPSERLFVDDAPLLTDSLPNNYQVRERSSYGDKAEEHHRNVTSFVDTGTLTGLGERRGYQCSRNRDQDLRVDSHHSNRKKDRRTVRSQNFKKSRSNNCKSILSFFISSFTYLPLI